MAEVENNGMSDISAIIEKFLQQQKATAPVNKINSSSNEELKKHPSNDSKEVQKADSEEKLNLEIPSQEEIDKALEKIGKEKFSIDDIVEMLNKKEVPKELIIKYLSAENGYLKPLKHNGFNFIDIEI